MYASLSEERRIEWDLKAKAGHEFLLAVRNGTVGDRKRPVSEEFLLLHSLLHDDPDGLLSDAATADTDESILTHVGADGAVYFGGVTYDQTDVGWAYILWAWEETGPTVPFVDDPVVLPIPDTATLAILGDWGGGNAPAQAVAEAATASGATHFVHLGDVYYAGTNAKGAIERDYQDEHFLSVWPGSAGASFNLNSNHDMYAHARGYFNTALASSVFAAQNGCGYFALYNSTVRFVGLDSAYYSTDPGLGGFMDGALNPSQTEFLHAQAVAAASAGQQLIVLTHHNGLAIDGSVNPHNSLLWSQVTSQLSPLSGKSVVWYWGHEHLGAVYAPKTVEGVSILSRCCGHGCIPWGIPSDLTGSDAVVWFEDQLVGPGSDYFLTSGFATIAMDGSSVVESFFGQDDSPHWTNTL